MKTEIFYGGDALSQSQLEPGDVMTTELLNEAIKKLLPYAYISKKRIGVLLTNTQLLQIHPYGGEMLAMIYFLPINTYHSNKKAQEAIISCGEKTIKIYTSKL